MIDKHATLRKILISIFAIIALAVLIALFIFKIVPGRENELHERGFRILSRIEKNFLDKKSNYYVTINEFYSRQHISNSFKLKNKDIISGKPIKQNGNDTLRKKSSFLVYDHKKENWDILFYGPKYELNKDNSAYKLNADTLVTYKYDFASFIEPLINYRKDFFEEYIIFSNNRVIYQSKNLSHGFNILKDSLLSNGLILTGGVRDIPLSEKNYKVFFHPFSNPSELDITICGIITEGKFSHETFLIDNHAALIIILCLLLIALSLPFFKIFTITKYERLVKGDIIQMILFLFGIGLILSIIFFSQIIHAGLHDWNDKSLVEMNKEICTRLNKELKDNVKVLNNIDGIYNTKGDNDTFANWYSKNFNKPFSVENNNFKKLFDKGDSNLTFIKNKLFIDTFGLVKIQWGAEADSVPSINVAKRKYFKEIIKGNPTEWNLNPSDTFNYSLQPIYSYLDQQNSVVISKEPNEKFINYLKSKNGENNIRFQERDLKVIAMETILFSVMHTITYQESGFCIIDKKGEVLFHSDNKRNLMENFLEECKYNTSLVSAIQNKSSVHLDLKFYGDSHNAYIQPVQNLPLYIITFTNNTIHNDMVADIMIFSLLMSLGIILMLILIIILFFIIASKASYLSKQRWDLTFLNYNKFNYSIALKLKIFLLINLLTFILGSLFLSGFDIIFFTFLMTLNIPAFLSVISWIETKNKFNDAGLQEDILHKNLILLRITLIIIFFIISLFILHIVLYPEQRSEKSIPLLVVMVLVYIPLIIFLLNRNFILSIIYKLNRKKLIDISNSVIKKKQIDLNPLIVILAVINICVIPSYIFIKEASRCESFLTQKRRNLNIIDQLSSRINCVILPFIDFSQYIRLNSAEILTKGIYTGKEDSILLIPDNKIETSTNHFNTSEKGKSLLINHHPGNSFTEFYLSLINKTRVNYQNYEIRKIFLGQDLSADHSWEWKYSAEGDSMAFIYNDPSLGIISPKEDLQFSIVSPLPSLNWIIKDWKKRSVFFIPFVLVLMAIYFIIRELNKKITLVEYFDNSNSKNTLDALIQSPGNFLVISIPGSGVQSKLLKYLEREGFNKADESMAELNKFECEVYENVSENSAYKFRKIILLNHFELKTPNTDGLNSKIKSIEAILKLENTKVIWICNYDPAVELEMLMNNRLTYYRKISDNENYSELEAYHNTLHVNDKMVGILNGFNKIHYPLGQLSDRNTFNEIEFKNEFQYLNNFIESELRHGEYLFSLRFTIYDTVKSMLSGGSINERGKFEHFQNLNEIVLLKIQEVASNYYLSIWNTLSFKERFVLYDLAIDNVTNYHNLSTLMVLKDKGLLSYEESDNCLKIFNNSFRNYILSKVKPEEASHLEKETHATSVWKSVKIAVIIFLVIAGGLIFFTQENAFKQIAGFAVAISSLLPLLLNLLKRNGSSINPSE